jgi:pyrroline-5-carboxylate reductase
MIVGFLGVGHLSATLIAGLMRAGTQPQSLLLSPRGRSLELSERYKIGIAASSEDLVRRSDMIVLAVRPHDAENAVAGLPWRAGQVLISVCAGVSLSSLQAAPARLVRAMPLTAAEINASPTVFFPDDLDARRLIERLGPAIALRSEQEFEVATVNAAIYGWAQSLISQSATWCAANGADAATMRQLVALTFVAAGRLFAENNQPVEQMLGELNVLNAAGQPQAWQQACEAVLKRLTGT